MALRDNGRRAVASALAAVLAMGGVPSSALAEMTGGREPVAAPVLQEEAIEAKATSVAEAICADRQDDKGRIEALFAQLHSVEVHEPNVQNDAAMDALDGSPSDSAGIARAFVSVAEKMGIPAIKVTNPDANWSWVLVCIDGAWSHVDPSDHERDLLFATDDGARDEGRHATWSADSDALAALELDAVPECVGEIVPVSDSMNDASDQKQKEGQTVVDAPASAATQDSQNNAVADDISKDAEGVVVTNAGGDTEDTNLSGDASLDSRGKETLPLNVGEKAPGVQDGTASESLEEVSVSEIDGSGKDTRSVSDDQENGSGVAADESGNRLPKDDQQKSNDYVIDTNDMHGKTVSKGAENGGLAEALSDQLSLSDTSRQESLAGRGLSLSPMSTEGISRGRTYYGHFWGSEDETNSYYFDLPTSGRIDLTGSFMFKNVRLYLYDAAGEQLWTEFYTWNSSTEKIAVSERFDLTSGTYYLKVENTDELSGDYNFKIAFKSAGERFHEEQGGNNNDFYNCSKISLGTTYRGQIAENDSKDFYIFDLPTSGRVTLTGSFMMRCMSLELYDEAGQKVWDSWFNWNSTTEKISVAEKLDLTAGTYRLAVVRGNGYTGNYYFKASFASAGETFHERLDGINNDFYSSSPISLGTTYRGQIARNDSKDFYVFDLPVSGSVALTGSFMMQYVGLKLYDDEGDEVWSNYYSWNSNTEKITVSEGLSLTKGTYRLAVVRDTLERTGNYYFKLASDHNIPSAHVPQVKNKSYTGSEIRPGVAVKLGGKTLRAGVDYTLSYQNNVKPGTATILITGKGSYYGTKKMTFRIICPVSRLSVSKSPNKTYNGTCVAPTVSVKFKNVTLKNGRHYTLSYRDSRGRTIAGKNIRAAGTYSVVIKGKGSYSGTRTLTHRVVKCANPLYVTTTNKVASYSTLRRSSVTRTGCLTVARAKGKCTYTKVGGSSCLSVNRTNGSISVAKGTRKGTYTIKVKVTSAGNSNYFSGARTVTTKIVVK